MKVESIVNRIKGFFSNSGYGDSSASFQRRAFRKFRSKSLSSRSDIDLHNGTLRSRARSLAMSAPLATSAIRSLYTSVIGIGLHLHAKVDQEYLGLNNQEAKRLNNEIEAEFELWANSKCASSSGLQNFYQLQKLTYVSAKISGDVFCLMGLEKPDCLNPYGLRIRLIEADRVSTPLELSTFNVPIGQNKQNKNNIFDGVEVNDQGRVVAYWVCNVFPGEVTTDLSKWVRVEKLGCDTNLPNIIHVMEAERPDQYRGVTCLAPVMESVLQLSRYLTAEEMAALLETYLTVYVTRDLDPSESAMGGHSRRRVPGDTDEDDEEEERDLDLGPGIVHELKPGEKINTVDPSRPSAAFDAFMRAGATQIGAAMGVPADVLLKSYNSSYSAARAALQNFWETVIMDRQNFADEFCDPTYESWFSEAVARGRIKAPGFFTNARARAAYLAHEWNGPAMTHLDPVKEARAMEIKVDRGWMTNTQATTQLNGGDYMQNLNDLGKETELKKHFLPEEKTNESN